MTELINRLRQSLASLEHAFCKLNRIQYDAPWKDPSAHRC